jgi:hypothetical protein
MTGLKVSDLHEETVFANADGVRGSGKRVFRRFPMIPAGWKAQVKFAVIDDEIPQDVFAKCLSEAGNLIGIGRFRPERGGYFGRFEVNDLKWAKV